MPSEWRRLWAFLTNDLVTAEGLNRPPPLDPPAWVTRANSDPATAKYALEASVRSAHFANSAVDYLQTKANSMVSLLLALIPIAAVGTSFAVSRRAGGVLGWASIVLFIAIDFLLARAAVLSFLAAGPIISVGTNLRRLSEMQNPGLAELAAGEAMAWHASAEVAMYTLTAKSRDLFAARRFATIAVVIALIAGPLAGASQALG